MKSLMVLIPAVLMAVGCSAQDVDPPPTIQATATLNTPISTALPTSTSEAFLVPSETPLPIPNPTEVYEAIVIVVPTRVPPGTPLHQSWLLQTAVRPEGAGNITLSPQQENQMYRRGSSITATANCDVDFLRWEGDIPDGLDKTANPMTITMDGPRILYLICVDPLQNPTAITVPQLDIMPIPKDIPAYNREDWEPWIDADRDCQNTRAEVLIGESLVPVGFRSDGLCTVDNGQWLAPYTGTTVTVAGDLDIDHMVPLANAHLSGGWAWTVQRKRSTSITFCLTAT